jgi:hypothetical protein
MPAVSALVSVSEPPSALDAILSERGLLPPKAAQDKRRPCAESEELAEEFAAYLGHKRSRLQDRLVLAIDCEMVEVTRGRVEHNGTHRDIVANALARCSVIDEQGNILLDEFILPCHR